MNLLPSELLKNYWTKMGALLNLIGIMPLIVIVNVHSNEPEPHNVEVGILSSICPYSLHIM